jgi:hypothetical protein
MRRALRATKAPRIVRAAAFEVIDACGATVARLGSVPGSDVDAPGVGLSLSSPDGLRRLTVVVDTVGPAIHLSQGGTVRCSIAIIDEELVLVALRDHLGREVASLVAADGSA